MSRLRPRSRLAIESTATIIFTAVLSSCGPVPRPADAYGSAPDLIADMTALREAARSLRATGRVDHFGDEHRVQGKVFVFAKLPQKLRVDLLSPFGSTISVLTVSEGRFAMSDLKEGRYMEGPADPCNIARLIRIPLPAADVVRVLVGHTPIIDGDRTVEWNRKGFYVITVEDGRRRQILHVGPDRGVLPLLRSRLEEDGEVVFDISFDRWLPAGGHQLPNEIKIEMPGEKVDLLLRYDMDGVETDVDLPDNAWTQEFPPGAKVEQVTCD